MLILLLRKVANALGCEVVYCMVPKNNATLEETEKNEGTELEKGISA